MPASFSFWAFAPSIALFVSLSPVIASFVHERPPIINTITIPDSLRETMDTSNNFYALATAAEERRTNEAIAQQLRRVSTSSNAKVSNLNLHPDATPAAAPGAPGNRSHVHDIVNIPKANDNRMPSLSFQKSNFRL
jgi:hypothetical protein